MSVHKDKIEVVEKFLSTIREEKEVELVMPLPESPLHQHTFKELRAMLNEARSGQHMLRKYSDEEFVHLKFVDEAVAILNYKRKLEERALTPAELKKREEIAQAIERDDPDMPVGKKMAIATATAKKVAEAVDTVKKDAEGNVTSFKHEGDWKKSKSVAMDKSGAKHTSYSKVRNLARNALAKFDAVKEESEQTDEMTEGLTPGVSLSKAYKKDFDGKRPERDHKEVALSAAYSDTSKPGGKLIKPARPKNESETLDELSGATLGSYIQKARANAKKKFAHEVDLNNDPKVKAATEKRKELNLSRSYTKDGRSTHAGRIEKLTKDISDRKKKIDPAFPNSGQFGGYKRLQGVDKAINRLTTGNKVTEGSSGLVQDRKTGKWYDPNKEFGKKMSTGERAAYEKGYDAFLKDVTKNPYSPGSEAAHQWNLGWETAQARTWSESVASECSLSEGKVKEAMADLKSLTDTEFIKQYNMTKAEMRKGLVKPSGSKKAVSEGIDESVKVGDTVHVRGGGVDSHGTVEKVEDRSINFRHENGKLYRVPHQYIRGKVE